MRVGATTRLDGVQLRVEEIEREGERIVRLESEIDPYRGGRMPLPPYIDRAADAEDTTRYQTVFAEEPGAVAAPTAGLHFTPEILAQLPHTFVTLHVGTGTFRPVQSEIITQHRMHAERFTITQEAAAAINAAQRILAVGTTSVRVLESAVRQNGRLIAQEGSTDIFIHPPYQVPRGGPVADEFSSAAFDFAHAGVRPLPAGNSFCALMPRRCASVIVFTVTAIAC